MAEILATIAEHVRGVIERRRIEVPLEALRDRPLFKAATRGFTRSLTVTGRRIIAEIKKASPSKGLIRADFNPVWIARNYAAHGAAALSVLTEERFFQGSLQHLENVRAAVDLPLLRKDFIVDPYQMVEAKSYGADAVLLIAALLEPGLIRELRETAEALSLDVLIEVHSRNELEAALGAGAKVIGINNRDLRTFEVSLSTTEDLASLVPSGATVVCESGIDSIEAIRRVEKLDVHVFLIGESLMRAPDPGAKLSELLRA
ncbi:MAG TPA: indole-3-glycerol phosphate synthase TrpC [Candidatus Binatia bacterium]|jgi:indole-3-glycerol phosphate synthase